MLKITGQRKFFYGYIVAAAGFVIWALGWGTYAPCFSVFLKPLSAEFGWSRAETSLALSLSYMFYGFLTMMMGWLTDKFGPRIVMMVLGSLLGLCYLLMSQVTALWQFQITYVIVGGIGISTLTVPVMVTTSRWFIKKRGLMIGIVQSGNGIGGFIFPPLAGWLILTYGWRSAYATLGIITFIGILLAGFFLRRDPLDIGQWPDGESIETVLEVKQLKPSFEAVGISLHKALNMKQFWVIAGLFSCFGFCRQAFPTHLAAHVQDLGFSLSDWANVLAVLIGSSMFSRIGMGRVADIVGNRPAFILSFAATALSLILGLVTKNLWGLYLFAFVFGFGWGNQAVLRFALTSEVFGLASLGLVMGALGFAEQMSAALVHIFPVISLMWWVTTNPFSGLGLASLSLVFYWHGG